MNYHKPFCSIYYFLYRIVFICIVFSALAHSYYWKQYHYFMSTDLWGSKFTATALTDHSLPRYLILDHLNLSHKMTLSQPLYSFYRTNYETYFWCLWLILFLLCIDDISLCYCSYDRYHYQDASNYLFVLYRSLANDS